MSSSERAEAASLAADDSIASMFLVKKEDLKGKAQSTDFENSSDYISFTLQDELYGIEVQHLREIIKPKGIVRVPGAAKELIGIINLRGTLISVIDLARRMGLTGKPIDKYHRVMIVHQHDHSIGLLVDRVNEILMIRKNQINPAPAAISTTRRDWLMGVATLPDQLIVLPDLEKVTLIYSQAKT